MENIFWIMVTMSVLNGEPSTVNVMSRGGFEEIEILENVPEKLKPSLMLFKSKTDCEYAMLVLGSGYTDASSVESKSSVQFIEGQAQLKLEVGKNSNFEHVASAFCVETKGPFLFPEDS